MVWRPTARGGSLRQAPCMTVNVEEQEQLLIFSIPCTARSCSSVVQRALIFWFDYKIKKKFPNEDMKTDIFPTCFLKTFHHIIDMRLICWVMGLSFSGGLNTSWVTFYPYREVMKENCTHVGGCTTFRSQCSSFLPQILALAQSYHLRYRFL